MLELQAHTGVERVKYSICIGAYSDKDVIYHLEKVKTHGFHGLEYYNWWDLDLKETARAQERIGVGINAICTNFFNLVDPTKREKYVQGIRETLEACHILETKSIITQTGSFIEGTSRELQQQAMIETLRECATLCEKAGITLEVEPLNGLDHHGHFLQYSDEAVYIMEQVNSSNVKLVFDVYHQQITEGNVIRNATNYVEHINHYHIADNPGRNEPGTGELNYVNILKAIKATGYNGFIGLEGGYTVDTDEALNAFKNMILTEI